MPLARIEVRKNRPAEEVTAIMEAVYQAQREALKVPEGDRQIRYIEHKPEHFAVPPGKTENYTLVEIVLFPGRTLDAKRNLYKSIHQDSSLAYRLLEKMSNRLREANKMIKSGEFETRDDPGSEMFL